MRKTFYIPYKCILLSNYRKFGVQNEILRVSLTILILKMYLLMVEVVAVCNCGEGNASNNSG